MQVSIVGTGYVGLVSGVCLADKGHDVVCIDVDARKVDMINAAQSPIHENGLPELLRRHAGRGLRATSNLQEAVAASDITFIAVGTPSGDGRIDLRFVERAANEIGAALRTKAGYHTVVVKSTVVPGTTDGVVRQQLEAGSGKRAGTDFGLGMNPEFLTEGVAVENFTYPDRLVLGGIDARTHAVLSELYTGFGPSVPRILTNTSTAEMIKYASNALLATMISFSNEIARLCSAVGNVDAADVMKGVHQAAHFTVDHDGRRSTAPITAFLEAGCGFGGSCLPKDVAALIGQGAAYELAMPMMRSVIEVNCGQPDEIMRLIGRHYPSLRDLRVAVLGIAFKSETDDVRESPAFPIIKRLRDAGARVTAYDPVARPENHPALAGVPIADSLRAAITGADVIVLVTRWAEFGALPALLRRKRNAPLVVDGRRMLNPTDYARYEGIGR